MTEIEIKEAIQQAVLPILATPAGYEFIDALKLARDQVTSGFADFESIENHASLAFLAGSIFALNQLIDAITEQKELTE